MPMNLGLGMGLSRRIGGGSAPPPALILDRFSAAAAFSPRLLRTLYTGPLLRARRSIDNAEEDFFPLATFDGTGNRWLDTTALLSFVGVGNGFDVTWYDQSGNARHLTNATAAQQPRLVNAGVLETLNSRPALYYDGNDDRLSNAFPFIYASGACTMFFVHKFDAPAPGPGPTPQLVIEANSGTTTQRYQIRANSDIMEMQIINDAGTVVRAFGTLQSTTFDNVQKVTAIRDSGSSVAGFRDGTIGSTLNYTRSGSLTLNRFTLGGSDIGGLQFGGPIGHLAEAIFIPANQSNADFNEIAANQGTAYGITVNPI